MASDNDQGRRFFTTSEVANYCAVTNDGVLKWIKSGKLRAFSTPGGHYRVSAEDFRSFLEKYEIPIDESFFRGSERRRTVLVVDDEPNIRDIVQRQEAGGGHRSRSPSSPRQSVSPRGGTRQPSTPERVDGECGRVRL